MVQLAESLPSVRGVQGSISRTTYTGHGGHTPLIEAFGWRRRVRGRPGVQGQLQLQNELEASLGYMGILQALLFLPICWGNSITK